MEEAEETNLNAAFAFLEVSSDPTSRHEEVEITLDRTVCSIEDEDQEVSFWIDEEQSHQESRIVLNEAISRITEGRVSPIASSLCSNWESSTIAPDQEDEVFEALLRSSGYDIKRKPAMMLRKMLLATKFQFCLKLTTNLKVVILDYKFSLCFPDIFRNRNSGR